VDDCLAASGTCGDTNANLCCPVHSLLVPQRRRQHGEQSAFWACVKRKCTQLDAHLSQSQHAGAAATSSVDASAHGGDAGGLASDGSGGGAQYDITTASEWPGGVGKEDVLIAPAEARSAWREFMSASTLAVQQVRRVGLAGCVEHLGGWSGGGQ